MPYSKKKLNTLIAQGVMSGNGLPLTPKQNTCPFCGEVFNGVPKWCPHCRKQVTKRGTSELIKP